MQGRSQSVAWVLGCAAFGVIGFSDLLQAASALADPGLPPEPMSVIVGTDKIITAADLEDYDRFASSVSADGDVLVVGAYLADVGANDAAGAAYVYERNLAGTNTWNLVCKLTAFDARTGDWFGTAVSVDGDTIVVGSPRAKIVNADRQGAAYVFERNVGALNGWALARKIVASDGMAYDYFGCAVTVSGDSVAVGADGRDNPQPVADVGAVYVYERNLAGTNTWAQAAKLNPPNLDPLSHFGRAVAMDGDHLAVGEPGYLTDRGRVSIFERTLPDQSAAWTLARTVSASDGEDNDLFGCAVDVRGDVLIAGASGYDGANGDSGAAYIFERNAGGTHFWGQVRTLQSSVPAVLGGFGSAVAAWGDRVLVGAAHAHSDRGMAYMFERNAGSVEAWSQVAQITPVVRDTNNFFGCSVALAGDVVVAGAYGCNVERGAAYLFSHRAADWVQADRIFSSSPAAYDYLGLSIALSGDLLAAGAPYDDDGTTVDEGSVAIFERNRGGANSWGTVDTIKAALGGSNDLFGCAVAFAGDFLAVGAKGDDSWRGSAYLYERNRTDTNAWGYVGRRVASDGAADDQFGASVAGDGSVLAIGAPGENLAEGAIYILERHAGGTNAWGQIKRSAASGSKSDGLGTSIGVAGDLIVSGAPFDSTSRGCAYIFERNQGGTNGWGEARTLVASDGASADLFGTSVGAGGDVILVSAPGDASSRGAAYIFERNAGGANLWGQVRKLTASDGAAGDKFGASVAISGSLAIVGAPGDDGLMGALYVFERNAGGTNQWGQTRKMKASDAAAGDSFGLAVATAGDLFAISSPSNDYTYTDRGSVYIFETMSVPELSITDATGVETHSGTTNFSFVVSLSSTAVVDTAVFYVTSNGTAQSGNDYNTASGVVTIPVGSISRTVSVGVRGDVVFEADEDFFLVLSSPSNAVISDTSARGLIQNDDSLPAMGISDAAKPEASSVSGLEFTIYLDASIGTTASVSWATSNDTALAGSDYTATSGVATVIAGSTSVTVRVNGKTDTLYEINETFWVVLSNPVNATLAEALGRGTVANDDPAPVAGVADSSRTEGENFVFSCYLNTSSSVPAIVSFSTSNLTATAGSDYDANSGTVTFPPGVTLQSFVVTNRQDAFDESDELFRVKIAAVADCTIGNGEADADIYDDDPEPTLAVEAVSALEGDSGSTTFVFHITLSAPSGRTVSFSYVTSDQTAIEVYDYTRVSGSIGFAPGVTATNISVAVRGDISREPDETFGFLLLNPNNAIYWGPATATILNDDLSLPSIWLENAGVTEGHASTTSMLFNVILDLKTGYDVSFSYATSNGTALAGSDYAAASGVAVIPAGEGSCKIPVFVNGDLQAEPNETLYLVISEPGNAVISGGQALGTIQNDDVLSQILSLSIVGSNAVVQWSAASGMRYTVQTATNLSATSAWSNLAPSNQVGPAAPPWSMSLTNPIPVPSPRGFYRIQVTPQ